MEVDGISSELEGLAHIEELNVLNACNRSLTAIGMHDHVRTELFYLRGLGVTLVQDVPGEQANLSPHLDELIIEPLNASVMLVLERIVQSNDWLLGVGVVN